MKKLFLVLLISVVCICQSMATRQRLNEFRYMGSRYLIDKSILYKFIEDNRITLPSQKKVFVMDTMKLYYGWNTANSMGYSFRAEIDEEGLLWLKDITLDFVWVYGLDAPDSLIMLDSFDPNRLKGAPLCDLSILNYVFSRLEPGKGVKMSNFSGFIEVPCGDEKWSRYDFITSHIKLLEIQNGKLVKEFEFDRFSYDSFKDEQFRALKSMRSDEYAEIKQRHLNRRRYLGVPEQWLDQNMEQFLKHNVADYISEIYKPEKYKYLTIWELEKRLKLNLPYRTLIENESIKLKGEKFLNIRFMGHASLSFKYEGKMIYIDPVGKFANYDDSPKADIVLITHQHDDHFDMNTIRLLSKSGTKIISTLTVIEELGRGKVMNNGDTLMLGNWLKIEAIPAYNTTPGREVFHPANGRDNGYVLTIGGSRIYIAGDGEPTLEMKALRNIDIAFLPVNQPYTMTVDQAAEAITAFKPKVFYPYHTGRADFNTDIDELIDRVRYSGAGVEIRIRSME